MSEVVQTLLPVILVIGLGALLHRLGLLPEPMVAGANRLVYFVGLPAVVVHSIASSGNVASDAAKLAGIFLVSAVSIAPGILAAWLLRLPFESVGTFLQASFRGNLAFVGIPVLAFAFSDRSPEIQRVLLATAALVFAPTMLCYNLSSVVVLQISKHRVNRASIEGALREILKNPLIIASIFGMIFFALGIRLPVWCDRTLVLLGDFAVPMALLGIGASLRPAQLHGRVFAVLTAALLKVAVLPLLGYVAAVIFHLSPDYRLILMVFCAAPAASASRYVLVVRMGGDQALASGAVFTSTILSGIALALVLLICGG